MNNARMVGHDVVDNKKNTASAKHVNDRYRRRVKRTEKEKLQQLIADGFFYCTFYF